MRIAVETGKIDDVKDELIVILCYKFDKNKLPFKGRLLPFLSEALENSNFEGKDNKSFSALTLGKIRAKKVVLVGLGNKEELNTEKIRRALSTAVCSAKALMSKSLSIEFPETELPVEEVAAAIVEGLILTNYSFDKYKSEGKTERVNIENCKIIASKNTAKIREQIKESEIICNNVAICRNVINENASIIYPENFAKIAKKLKGVKAIVFDEKKLAKLGFGLHLAVGIGSAHPPRLVIIEYNGNPKSGKRTVLVGKGITYDTGGYNLKPTGFMETMRSDMAGAACVLYTIKALSELKIKQNIIGLCAMAENCVSDRSYKPGDTFVGYSGKSVEIGNTDAEGRLVLADSLAYSKNFKPDLIIDLATLTGACVVALGPNIAGLFTEDDATALRLIKASQQTGDRIWQLPMYDEIREEIKSDIADITNSSKLKYGGAIQAAVFLQKFVPDNTKWAHLDIAGPAFLEKPNYYNTKMATGFGVRLLVQFFKDLKLER